VKSRTNVSLNICIFAFKKRYKLRRYLRFCSFFSRYYSAVSFYFTFLSYTFLDSAGQSVFKLSKEYSVGQTNPEVFDIKHDNKIQKYDFATRPPSTLKGRGKSRSSTNLLKFSHNTSHICSHIFLKLLRFKIRKTVFFKAGSFHPSVKSTAKKNTGE